MADRVVVYRWDQVRLHLESRLSQLHRQIEAADSDMDLWRLQGRAKELRELLNLPETLTVLTE